VLTRQGWLTVWGTLALLALGKVMGITELYVIAGVAIVLLIGALIYVQMNRLELEIHRRVHPARAHAGSTSRVEIHLRNTHGSATPLLRLEEDVSGTTGAEMLLPPIAVGGHASASYRLPTARRGVLRVGPLKVVTTDPFGLAQNPSLAADPVDVTIYPRIHTVQPVPFTVGHDPLAGAAQANSLSNSGDDFYALRPYVMGDDLRRIHWPSTARHDELLICQHEQPWQGRTTVLLDLATGTYSSDGLETAVSAAASVANANMKRNDLVRLLTSDGQDTGFGMGRAHLEVVLERLALAQPTDHGSFTRAAAVLQRDKGSGGALVAVTGPLTSERATTLNHLRRRVGLLIVVEVTEGLTATTPAPAAAPGLPRVRLTGEVAFTKAWNEVLTDYGPTTVGRRAG
jgi:uncharacterized protein (DUF58 family)